MLSWLPDYAAVIHSLPGLVITNKAGKNLQRRCRPKKKLITRTALLLLALLGVNAEHGRELVGSLQSCLVSELFRQIRNETVC